MTKYSILTRILHWLSAIILLSLFALGTWMVDLNYYHDWYKTAPDIHKSLGMLLLLITVIRLINITQHRKLTLSPDIAKWQVLIAKGTHCLLYLLIFCLLVSGYLISTADGRAISIFGLIDIPALLSQGESQAELAGLVHEYLAYSIISLAIVHALAALKHHFINRNDTLKRML
ncbi:cytochrome b [Saccharobesus litoralis]|uniref:Cytochrome b n=1 Tax=Saccharobesus litoralis TaxID=2172099 RepID=A0A2S0VS45_9ALTE|nr:cytochrome b [Saccharobesus litoralis]AWB67045.1 cytochrome b [Saccharobesus litoralis]